MDYDYKEMGKLIRNLRKQRAHSQDVLSGLSGIGRSHLAMIENGRKTPVLKRYGASRMPWINE